MLVVEKRFERGVSLRGQEARDLLALNTPLIPCVICISPLSVCVRINL